MWVVGVLTLVMVLHYQQASPASSRPQPPLVRSQSSLNGSSLLSLGKRSSCRGEKFIPSSHDLPLGYRLEQKDMHHSNLQLSRNAQGSRSSLSERIGPRGSLRLGGNNSYYSHNSHNSNDWDKNNRLYASLQKKDGGGGMGVCLPHYLLKNTMTQTSPVPSPRPSRRASHHHHPTSSSAEGHHRGCKVSSSCTSSTCSHHGHHREHNHHHDNNGELGSRRVRRTSQSSQGSSLSYTRQNRVSD